jgi:hypothetical protein
MEAICTAKTSVYFNKTKRAIYQKAVIFMLAAVSVSNLTRSSSSRF